MLYYKKILSEVVSMRKKNDDMPRCCAYCEKATPLETGDMLCRKKGVVADTYCCRGFKFDILKHEPKRKRELPEFLPVYIDD